MIRAQGRRDIKVKFGSLVAGDYELKLKLANGAVQTLRLEVAASSR